MQLADIPYTVRVTKKAKRISLRINASGLSIVTPHKLPQVFINDLLTKHSDWITKNLPTPKTELPEIISILDHPYELILVFGNFQSKQEIWETLDPAQTWDITKVLNSFICSSETQLVIYATDQSAAKKSLYKWIASNAKEVLIDRTIKLARKFGFEFNNVAVKDQITRWGSCSSQKNLNFNWRLVLAPKPVMEYVIIHELAHTKQMNHSAKFWAEVAHCMPNYKTYRTWLKQHTDQLREI